MLALLGGVRHGVEKPSNVGTLPQCYEWCTNWEYGPLAKEDPPISCMPCHCDYHSGAPLKHWLESMVIEVASPLQGGPTPLPEALNPESADPRAEVCSMKVTLAQMTNLMHTVLLVFLCKGWVWMLHRRFTDSSGSVCSMRVCGVRVVGLVPL